MKEHNDQVQRHNTNKQKENLTELRVAKIMTKYSDTLKFVAIPSLTKATWSTKAFLDKPSPPKSKTTME